MTGRALKIENQSHLGDTERRGSESYFSLAAAWPRETTVKRKEDDQ